jgi:hypothetical protein
MLLSDAEGIFCLTLDRLGMLGSKALAELFVCDFAAQSPAKSHIFEIVYRCGYSSE